MIFSNTNWQTPGRNEEAAADETQFASHDFDSDEDREFVDLDDESRDLDDDHVSSSQHRVAVTSYQNFSESEEVKWINFYKLSVIIGVKLFKLIKLEKWLSFKLTSIFEKNISIHDYTWPGGGHSGRSNEDDYGRRRNKLDVRFKFEFVSTTLPSSWIVLIVFSGNCSLSGEKTTKLFELVFGCELVIDA